MKRVYKEMDIEEMLEGKFKKARFKARNLINANTKFEKDGTIPKEKGSSNNIIPRSKQREIFFNLKESRRLPSAQPMKEELVEARRNGKYCEYGHSKENCRNLAKVINQVFRSQEIQKLPDPPKLNQGFLMQASNKEYQSNEDEEIEETIFIIMGGEGEEEKKRSLKRSHCNSTVSFSGKDLEGVTIPH